jgi:hypothetical protein
MSQANLEFSIKNGYMVIAEFVGKTGVYPKNILSTRRHRLRASSWCMKCGEYNSREMCLFGPVVADTLGT